MNQREKNMEGRSRQAFRQLILPNQAGQPLIIIAFALLISLIPSFVSAQCNYSNQGNQVLSPPQVCAPHDFMWRVEARVAGTPASVEYLFFWGDNPLPEIFPSTYDPITGYYHAIGSHTYPRGGDQCEYEPTVQLRINGVACPDSEQKQLVTVWDLDNENGGQLRIDPEVYRVCVGEDATISFNDNSIWNCVPASGADDRINNAVRWVQWIYGTGPAADRLADVEVGGAVQTYDYAGDVAFLQGPIINSTAVSQQIYVPVTTAADLGKQFEVTLRNWNICNPYDADTTDGNYLNPVNPGGDENFISQTARIVVVEKSNPDFRTRLNNGSGVIKSEFCVGEQVHFENLTPGIDDDGDGTADSDFGWRWEIFDDETGSSLLEVKTGKSPNLTFTNPGRKLIRLIASDRNTVGNCGGQIVHYVDILSTPEAAIQTTDIDDNPLGALCYDSANPQNFNIRFSDVSLGFNPANSTWKWIFYDQNGVKTDSVEGSGTQQQIDKTYTQPGIYMAELIASSLGVDCESRDTAYVNIYHQPEVDFTFDVVCATDSTTFTSTANLPLSVNGDQLILYEWDFDYDGSSFSADTSMTTPQAFKYSLGFKNSYQVAHRVSSSVGNCSAIAVKDVSIKPTPDPAFTASQLSGCSPLEVTFTPNTLIADQNATIESYIWYVRDLKTNIVSSTILSPATDSFETEFFNTQSAAIDHEYEVWLSANAAGSCDVISDPVKITVFSGPQSRFSILNYSGLENNCSPRTYDFKVDAETRTLNPDTYRWHIMDVSDSTLVVDTVMAGSQSVFSYTLYNEVNTVKKYSVTFLAEKNGLCFSESSRIVDVNPVPPADFTYEIIDADCDQVTYQITAAQPGLSYEWSVNPSPANDPDLDGETIQLKYFKSASSAYPVRVSLITENLVGCNSEQNLQTITIEPQENIGAEFTTDPTITEVPNQTIQIINNTNPGNWEYYWDFGDGATSTEANPISHTYNKPGEYMIRMRADGLYCYEEDSAKVIIRQTLPQLDFSFSTIEGCLPLEVTFVNESLYADSSTFFWDFGNGATSTEINPVYTYTESGIYTVSLEASNELGVVMRKEVDIVVDLNQGPKADFRIRLAQAYLPGQEISFFNQSQRSEFHFWDFGDGSTSTETEPSHVYEAVGNYEIMLVTSNTLGCADTTFQSIFIEPFHPEIDFTYEPPKGCRPLTVQFRNLSRFAEPGSYRWSFGEGEGVSTEENPSYTYYEPGIYTISLEASNSIGITEKSIKEFSVEVYETPRASFNMRPDEAFLTEPIYFVNLSIGAEKYYWDFGDGNFSTDFEPSHVYTETGVYDVMLVVESDKGCTDTLTMESAVIIKEGGKINIPNAFTPNTLGPGGSDASGASKNDVFLPVFEGVTSFHMMVYNRWGELMFESYDKNFGWDGYYKGKLSPMDVYVYKLELEFSNGKSETIVGDLSLLR